MSRTCPSALENHLALSTTTTSFVMKVERRDGVTLRLTDHDRDIPFEGEIYSAEAGGVPSASSLSAGLELASLNIAGAFLLSGVSRSDLLAGRYDRAAVTVSRVNWREPSQGALESFSGYFGEVAYGDREFEVDCFGMEHLLLQKIGEVYSKTCKAQLGDARCKVNLASFTETGSVTAVVSQREIECSITNNNGRSIEEDDWFADGSLLWTSGDNINLYLELKSSSESEGVFTLKAKHDAPFTIQIGDSFNIVAGCRKRWVDCKEKFSNGKNYRGFKDLPGPDALQYKPRVKLGI